MISPPLPTGSATTSGSPPHGQNAEPNPDRWPESAASMWSRMAGSATSMLARDARTRWPSRATTAATMSNIPSYWRSSASSAAVWPVRSTGSASEANRAVSPCRSMNIVCAFRAASVIASGTSSPNSAAAMRVT
jgi:hypothetical protein